MDQEINSNTEGMVASGKLRPDMGILLTDAAIAEIRRRMTQEYDARQRGSDDRPEQCLDDQR